MLSQRTIRSALALALVAALPASYAAPLPEPKAVTPDDSKWLFADAEVFVKVNVKQMLASDLMKKGGTAKLKEAINSKADVKAVLQATDIDPTKDVDTILASGPASTTSTKGLIVIRGRFNQQKIHDTLKKVSEKDEKVKLVKEGQTQLYEFQTQDKPMYAAFVDRTTIVLTGSKDATVDAVKNGGQKAAEVNKNLKGALAKFTGKESVAVALVVTDDLRNLLGGIPNFGPTVSKLKTVNASITLTDGVALKVDGYTGDAPSAKKIADLLNNLKGAAGLNADSLPPGVGDLLNAVQITSTRDTAKVDVKVTKDMIDKANKGGAGQ